VRRFISPDTLVPDPTDPQDLNRSTYAKNNPMRYTDPTGQCVGPVLIVCAIGGGAVVVMGGATIATQPTQSAPAVDVAALAAPITQPMDEAALVLQVGGEMARPYLAQQGMDLAAQGTGLIAQGLVWYAEATGETPEELEAIKAKEQADANERKRLQDADLIKRLKKQYGLTKKQAESLHRRISKEGWSPEDVEDEAANMEADTTIPRDERRQRRKAKEDGWDF
jgi:hypothetical protein